MLPARLFCGQLSWGYDVAARIAGVMLREGGHSSHAIGPMFGGTRACASLAKLDARQACHALAYAGQQASGIKIMGKR